MRTSSAARPPPRLAKRHKQPRAARSLQRCRRQRKHEDRLAHERRRLRRDAQRCVRIGCGDVCEGQPRGRKQVGGLGEAPRQAKRGDDAAFQVRVGIAPQPAMR